MSAAGRSRRDRFRALPETHIHDASEKTPPPSEQCVNMCGCWWCYADAVDCTSLCGCLGCEPPHPHHGSDDEDEEVEDDCNDNTATRRRTPNEVGRETGSLRWTAVNDSMDDTSNAHHASNRFCCCGRDSQRSTAWKRKEDRLWDRRYLCCWAPMRRNMTPMEATQLSPLAKWRLFGLFPYKLVIHITIAVLVAANAVILSTTVFPYLHASENTILHFFMPSDFFDIKESAPIGFPTAQYFSFDDVQEHIRTIVNTVYSITNTSIGVLYSTSVDGLQYPVILRTRQYPVQIFTYTEPFDSSLVDTEYLLSPDNLGPFNEEVSPQFQRDFYDRLHSMTISYILRNTDLSFTGFVDCILWDIKNTLSFVARGGMLLETIEYHSRFCDNKIYSDYELVRLPLFWINLTLMIFALWSLFLILKAVFRSFRIYKSLRQTRSFFVSNPTQLLSNVKKDWSGLGCRERCRFFNVWFFVTISANIFNIVSVILSLSLLTSRFFSHDIVYIIVGMSAFLSWINLVRYFEYYPKFYLLIMTMRRGVSNGARFIIGSAPVFIGYAFLGTIVFGSFVDYFATFDESCVTLFSVLNGDVIHDTFDMVAARSPGMKVFSRIYMYSFVALFIYLVLNVFILITEDAFFRVKDMLSVLSPSDDDPPVTRRLGGRTVCPSAQRRRPENQELMDIFSGEDGTTIDILDVVDAETNSEISEDEGYKEPAQHLSRDRCELDFSYNTIRSLSTSEVEAERISRSSFGVSGRQENLKKHMDEDEIISNRELNACTRPLLSNDCRVRSSISNQTDHHLLGGHIRDERTDGHLVDSYLPLSFSLTWNRDISEQDRSRMLQEAIMEMHLLQSRLSNCMRVIQSLVSLSSEEIR